MVCGRVVTVGTAGGNFTAAEGRHLETANYLFADGHVKALRGSSVSSGYPVGGDNVAQGGNYAESVDYSGTGAHAVTFNF